MKILSVVGARPNFVKIAPIISAIDRVNRQAAGVPGGSRPISHVLVHTGQHYDKAMSDVFFQDLRLPEPDIFLGAGSGSHAEQTAEIMKKFEGVLLTARPDIMVVVGDVNSTLACTLVASKIAYDEEGGRPLIAHVEAGLRSFDRSMPEEVNRLVTDALADFLFTPSEDADGNLLREGVAPEKIVRVGNVMIDTLASNLDRVRAREIWKEYGLEKGKYAFVTLHRPGNVDHRAALCRIIESLERISGRMDVVFPVHPRTRKQMASFGLSEKAEAVPGLRLTGPLSYLDTIGLVDGSRFVLTDSGGLQEETTYLQVPCLTLRPNTERPVTITRGTNRLTSLGTLDQDIASAMNGASRSAAIPDLWDGFTADRIIAVLLKAALDRQAAEQAA